MTVLIPAYEPDQRLLELIMGIRVKCDFNIVIVDDGSGNAYTDIFSSARKLGCTVLTHAVNQGKGNALKTGFNYIKDKAESLMTWKCEDLFLS
jgi:glycosyltransferase involved in cell wall biosynthesis